MSSIAIAKKKKKKKKKLLRLEKKSKISAESHNQTLRKTL